MSCWITYVYGIVDDHIMPLKRMHDLGIFFFVIDTGANMKICRERNFIVVFRHCVVSASVL